MSEFYSFQMFEEFDYYEIELVGYPDSWAVVGVNKESNDKKPKLGRYYLSPLGNSVEDTKDTNIGIYNEVTAERVAKFFYKRARNPIRRVVNEELPVNILN